jgi:hypothetical protein
VYGGLSFRPGDAGGLDVEARDAAAGALCEVERRTAGATSYIEEVDVGAKAEEVGDVGLLVASAPAGLADVAFAIHLAAQGGRETATGPAVVRTVEVEPANVRFLGCIGHRTRSRLVRHPTGQRLHRSSPLYRPRPSIAQHLCCPAELMHDTVAGRSG